jgi:SWI/SNF-related matrix-associated actin-dependent regulator of chromatin subfamily A-like protein 1
MSAHLNILLSDQTDRSWSFHINEYMQLCDQLRKFRDFLNIEGIPEFAMKIVKKEDKYVPHSNLDHLEPALVNTLYDFQKEAVLFGISKGGRLIIADDMGLGKTREALGIADFYRNDWPLLIVTTAAMRSRWHQEILLLFPKVHVANITVITPGKQGISDAKIVICSYAALAKCKEKLMRKGFGVIIFDESHNIKNSDSNQTKNATQLSERAARTILVTGTPAMARPCELFSQLTIIDKGFCGFKAYAKRYCDSKVTRFGLDSTGSSNLRELEVILRKKFMIRRMKDEVQSMLPEKIRKAVKLKDVNFAQEATQEMIGYSAKYKSAERQDQKHDIMLKWFVETAKLKQDSVW